MDELTPEDFADRIVANLHGQDLGCPRRPYDDADVRKAVIDVCNEIGDANNATGTEQ